MNAPRAPTEIGPPRIGALSRLPLFFALDGKRALVAGGAAAIWKAELLAAAGAEVAMFFEPNPDNLRGLEAAGPAGKLVVHNRRWRREDFHGIAFAVCACDDDKDAERFVAAAHAAGALVNVVDKPACCDFTFGAIVNRSPLVIGISTDGAAPAFAVAIRAWLEALIPGSFAQWVRAARQWRKTTRITALSRARRMRFWAAFARHAMACSHREPAEADFDKCLQVSQIVDRTACEGSVVIAGAGPGDPELLTLRALRALQSADVVFFDDRVAQEILDFARREAQRIRVGISNRGLSCKQEDVNAMMIALARRGKRVVRLKGGDPMIFRPPDDELAACRTAQIPVEIVPGISAVPARFNRCKPRPVRQA